MILAMAAMAHRLIRSDTLFDLDWAPFFVSALFVQTPFVDLDWAPFVVFDGATPVCSHFLWCEGTLFEGQLNYDWPVPVFSPNHYRKKLFF